MSTSIKQMMQEIGQRARVASRAMARASSEQKNQALIQIAKVIRESATEILQVNSLDVEQAKQNGQDAAFIDRLTMTSKSIESMALGLEQIVSLTDPIGQVSVPKKQASGIEISQMRVPLGVIGIIYESRPNVTIDAAALCLKSGNAVILRGGSEAIHSNTLLAKMIQTGLSAAGLPRDAVQVVQTVDRAAVGEMITMTEYIDVIVPRGGKSLIARLMAEARVPMIKHLDGICHTYIDADADLAMAVKVCDNAKTQRYAPCNAMETLLVNQKVASQVLPTLCKIYQDKGVELRVDTATRKTLESAGFGGLVDAQEEDWSTEYLAPILSIKTVANLDEAINHIERYGSKHTDAIITKNQDHANRFLREVDSASVMVNASTRFADGFEYGLGAEIGISNDKLHARGPVGLEGLTSLKYIVMGHGEIRT
ncbi:glutamate-5-semialdehyde dehydrogenase [Polynucleobacter paneuropaeus]|jgi:glutamate-5-semialdehyde dehydrogenase|uniref:glutamate-5-semialdehyde dehydrogenase n=1 Tax=Polynucleobacter paneuropaeus TaxID=2527775 RepID=UPI001BFDD0A4|nr:glutamate-5-semialdehyde dehydrogenase [Polynucleobacter paneuropaeus]MBT8518962.1 glutamate-5-semialdehyde dehydrogenase [Polynucleobacter paneuropaeus]MBT8525881.1 glutamate-5-semialdehyde dehydrogenase [Polynucleobacter paneuropaeus]MBT8529240.1 glutamate-5-semialdehyde dehydrogenase [Polynucleobacter paneuropaeus]MBT8532470.1 glutamate-5-semialdehyde dehydrogenase [Polynucleobacter paneuropaeus]MBT8567874.1 glutamate-5-semialdehyde dehydrogenase [Polynucleobacter paneuropaeus]